jgi:CRISPR/Cas system-associated exonuclease Cas4 (RecB family)
MKKPNIIPMILEQVEREVTDEWRPQRVIGSFRGSELGDCPRYIQYTLRGFEREPISPELGLLFNDGHLHHNAIRNNLSKVGRVTNVEFAAWKRYKVELGSGTEEFNITATVDCVFNRDYVIDIKSINPFSFKALSKEYIQTKYLGYVYQIQAYLDILEKDLGALLFKDKAFSGMKIFWYKKNSVLFENLLRRLANIHRATVQGKWIKRPYTKSSTECKRCPMRQHCWGVKMNPWGQR